ncbi:MAG TPA: HGGxSTG domain-containing protein, partial [Croceibacterium sp.]|nr:HGGxSTG domain-containing protein [Croceibacterium sp.]
MASDHRRNVGPMQAAARCERIKRNGERCRAPAVTGRARCRAHGGKAGAPAGNSNALIHGMHTKAARERDRTARALIKLARGLLGEIGALPDQRRLSGKSLALLAPGDRQGRGHQVLEVKTGG